MANRDEVLRELVVQMIRAELADPILIKSLLRYNEDKAYDNPLDIPSLGYVQSLISGLFIKDKPIVKSGADVTDYELDLSAETEIPYPANASLYINQVLASMATWNFATKTWYGLPDTVSADVIEAYYVGREFVAPVITPNTAIAGMNFGSASAIQAYLISKGNTGAVVDGYSLVSGQEIFRLNITSLAANTFLGQPITSYSSSETYTEIGGNCFASSDIVTFAVACQTIDVYAFTNCAALTTIGLADTTSIEPGAFQNATGLNGKTISLPALVSPNGLGGSPGNEIVFDGITGLTINVPSGFATNNSGSPDGDLAAVTSAGGTVNYI